MKDGTEATESISCYGAENLGNEFRNRHKHLKVVVDGLHLFQLY